MDWETEARGNWTLQKVNRFLTSWMDSPIVSQGSGAWPGSCIDMLSLGDPKSLNWNLQLNNVLGCSDVQPSFQNIEQLSRTGRGLPFLSFWCQWTASHHLGSWLRRTPAESLSWFQGLSLPSPRRGSHSFLLWAAHPFAAQQGRQLNATAQCCIPRLRAHCMDREGPHVQRCLPNSFTEINIKLTSVFNLTISGLRGCRSVISSLPLWAYHLWVQFVNPNRW